MVYLKWRERNSRIFQHLASDPSVVIAGMESNIRGCLNPWKNTKMTDHNRLLFIQWNISFSVFPLVSYIVQLAWFALSCTVCVVSVLVLGGKALLAPVFLDLDLPCSSFPLC